MRFIVKPVTVYDVIDTETTDDNDGFMSRQATEELAQAVADEYERTITP